VTAGLAARAAQIVLPGRAVSVRAARRFTAAALPGCPRADDLVLAVSELASNAVTWSASGQEGAFTVRVRAAPGWARVEVTDAGPAAGEPPAGGNGWGLLIVAEVTDRCGTVTGPDGSRTAWAEVTWGEPPASAAGGDLPAHDCGDHQLTAGCPLDCLASRLSAQAYQPLRRELPWLLRRPVTVGDVTDMYLRSQLRHVRYLGRRRIGEIAVVLILAGLLAPPGDPPGPCAGRPG